MTVGRLPSIEGGIQPTIVDAKGDLITATAADTPARIAVGANDTVLTADSTTATGLKWSTVSAGANWSLLNAGGTSLTAASSITVSGISAKDKVMIFLSGASFASAGSFLTVRFNSDSGNNYGSFGMQYNGELTYAASNMQNFAYTATSGIFLGYNTAAASTLSGYVELSGCNAAGNKLFTAVGAPTAGGSDGSQTFAMGGYYTGSSTISSVTVSGGSNFDAGTIFVYTSA